MNLSFSELFSKINALFSGRMAAMGVRRLMNPTRDWYIAIFVWVLIMASVASVSTYIFFLVDTGGSGFSTKREENPDVDRSLLRETLTFFEGEAAEFEALRKNPPPVPKAF